MNDYILILDIIGIIAFCISGYILSSRAGFDILGVIVIAFIASFGGGVIRDLLVDRKVFIFHETYPILIVLLTIIVSYIFKFHNNTKLTNNPVFILSDSIGLSIFAYTGAMVGLEYELNLGGIVFLSFLTAVGGGILRDIIMNQVPFVLTNDFYGTVAIIIGIVVWAMDYLNISTSPYTITIIITLGTLLRLIAIKNKWKLPILFSKD